MGTDLSASAVQARSSRCRTPEVILSPRSDCGAEKGDGSLVSLPVISGVRDVAERPITNRSRENCMSVMFLMRFSDRIQFL